MREGWKKCLLLDVCKVYQPQTIATSQLIEGAQYDVFGANGCIGKYNQYNHEEDEVLLTCRGATCGNINRSTPKSWINGNAMVVHPIGNALIKDFLMNALKSVDFSKVITGAAQPQITRTSLSSVTLFIPPLYEQERIVSFLDSQFAKIDAIKANAEKQLQDAKALFQSALKDLLTPKEGWEMKKLEEIAKDMYRGAGITRSQVTQDGIPCVRYGEIYTTYNYSFDTCVSHTDESTIRPQKYFEKGDILFAITGESVEDIGKSIAYLGNDKCLAGGDVVVMKHSQNSKYISYALSTPDAIRQKGLGKTKLKVVHTNVPSLKSIIIPIPSIPEQNEIADNLDKIRDKIQSLQSNYDQTIKLCNDLKQSLLKDIFN